MNILVLYNSRTGFSAKYAQWIAEELGCPARPYKGFSGADIEGLDAVIFCGRVYTGRIEHLRKLKALLKSHRGKQLIVAATGATPITSTDMIAKLWSDNFTPDELAAIPRFYLQGGLSYERMGRFDKTFMKILARALGSMKDKSDAELSFSRAIANSHDISSREYIAPLISHVKDMISKSAE